MKIQIAVSILIAFLSSCEISNPLVNDYKLLIIEYQDSTGAWLQSDWMKGGTGNLTYSPDGLMAVEFIPKDTSNQRYWYKASYQYDGLTGIVKHTRLVHSDPKEVGKTVQRNLEIRGDTLFMKAEEFGLRLTWIRQPSSGRP